MIKAEEDVCEHIGGTLVEKTDIYDNILKNLTDKQRSKFEKKVNILNYLV